MVLTVCACCCCTTGMDTKYIALLTKSESECICCFSKGCLAIDEEPFGCGPLPVVEETGECVCKFGLYCCEYGFKTPSYLCNIWARTLCCVSAQSCPCNETAAMDSFTCVLLFMGCKPCGVCPDFTKELPTKTREPILTSPGEGDKLNNVMERK